MKKHSEHEKDNVVYFCCFILLYFFSEKRQSEKRQLLIPYINKTYSHVLIEFQHEIV